MGDLSFFVENFFRQVSLFLKITFSTILETEYKTFLRVKISRYQKHIICLYRKFSKFRRIFFFKKRHGKLLTVFLKVGTSVVGTNLLSFSKLKNFASMPRLCKQFKIYQLSFVNCLYARFSLISLQNNIDASCKSCML